MAHNRPGLVSMANTGPGSNGGQVTITLVPAPHLDGKYSVFAEVVSGFDVLLEVGTDPMALAPQTYFLQVANFARIQNEKRVPGELLSFQ